MTSTLYIVCHGTIHMLRLALQSLTVLVASLTARYLSCAVAAGAKLYSKYAALSCDLSALLRDHNQKSTTLVLNVKQFVKQSGNRL
jgi:hypothetical protein